MILSRLIVAVIAASLFSVTFAQAQQLSHGATNTIENYSVAQQGKDIAVRIDLRDPVATLPVGFSVSNPPKVALDFQGVSNSLGKSSQILNQGDLRSLNVVQAGDRTRLVFNLSQAMQYQSRLEGKSIYVTLSPLAKAGDVNVNGLPGRFSEESLIGKRHWIQDVAFRRGKEGEGRIVVDLSDNGTGIDVKQQGSALFVDFLKTSLPPHLLRKLDVTDFATPVAGVDIKAQGNNVRMVINPVGNWEHSAYQSDKQFVVEVRRVVEDSSKLVQGTKIGYQGPKVSINYQNGDVRALLRLMAEELGLNAVISETVSGTTTLVLKDVPADQVIDIIFQQKGLDMRKKGSIIMIAPRDEIATREKLEFESKQQISDLEPLRLEQFNLNYQKAVDVARLLQGGGASVAAGGAGGAISTQRILSKRGSAIADSSSNILFVSDIAAKIDEVRALVKAIDIGSRQVLIEARVVEATDSFNRSLGFKLNFLTQKANVLGGSGWNAIGGKVVPANLTTSSTISNGVATTTSAYTPALQTTAQTAGVNLPSYTSTGGTLAFSLFNSGLTKILNVELAALESDGLGKVISSPRVITANNVRAKIEDGTEVPYVVTQSSATGTTQTVAFKSAKLSLEVTPQITPEGTVKMNLLVKKEEPDWTKAILNNPPIKSSVVETNVVVDNGGTVVIGGVFITSNQDSVEKVPLLGDIPFFGWLFKNKNDIGSRRELLVFITPRVLTSDMRFE